MSNEIIEKLRQENELTIEEIYYVLNEIVSITRKYLKEVPIGNAKKCNESDYKIGQICSKFNLAYWPYTTSKLSDDRLFHKFGLIIFNINSKPIIFIMDLTYNQFITDEYEGKGKDSPAFYLDNQLLQKLISNGYLNFTEFNFENYIKSFICASNNLNDTSLLNFVHDDLKKFGIKFNTVDDYSLKLIELNNENKK